MKRFFAILLTAIFCISLTFAAETEIPAAQGEVTAESGSESSNAAESGEENTGSVDTQGTNEANDEAGGESEDTASPNDTNDEDADSTNDEAPAVLDASSNSASLSFNAIARTLRENNLTIQANNKTLQGIGAANSNLQEILLEMSLRPLLDLKDDLDDAMRSLDAVEDSHARYVLGANLRATYGIIQGNIDAINSQLKSLEDGTDYQEAHTLAKKQFDYAEEQMVLGAQTLFITVKSLELQQTDLERSLATMNRTVAEMEKRFELGQISEIDLLTIKNQYKQLDSGIQSLALQISNLTSDIASLVGFSPSTTLTLNALPAASAPARNLQTDQAEVIKNSYTLYFKNDDIRVASNNYRDDVTLTLHTFEAAKLAYQAAESELIYSFRKLYTDIDEKQRLLTLARENEAFQQRLYDIADVQYSRGMISRNELLSARDELETVKSDTKKAEVELFTVVNTYNWALKGVI